MFCAERNLISSVFLFSNGFVDINEKEKKIVLKVGLYIGSKSKKDFHVSVIKKCNHGYCSNADRPNNSFIFLDNNSTYHNSLHLNPHKTKLGLGAECVRLLNRILLQIFDFVWEKDIVLTSFLLWILLNMCASWISTLFLEFVLCLQSICV